MSLNLESNSPHVDLDFNNGFYSLNGQGYSAITQVPGWTYTGGTPLGTGSYAPKADGTLQFFPSYTNQLVRSQLFQGGLWGLAQSATVGAAGVSAPDGTSTALTITSGGVAASGPYQFPTTIVTGSTYTGSVYIHNSGTATSVYIGADNGPTTGYVTYNPTTSIITASGASVISSSVQLLTNGWRRVSVTWVATSTTSDLIIQTTSGIGTTFTIWGAQLELGSVASAYIPTVASTVTGAPRITDSGYLVEEARTNSIRNSTSTNGSVLGVVGSGGALPTNWGHSGGATAGLTVTVAGLGTDAGMPYIDIRYSGTTNSTSLSLIFESTSAIAASAAQVWTASVYVKLVSGSLANITNVYAQVDGVGGSAGSGPGSAITPSSTLTRATSTYTLGTGATNVRSNLTVAMNNSAAVDATFRVYQPQLELGAFVTSPIPTTNVAVTRNADVGYITSTSLATNLLVQSQTFDNATWFKTSATATADAVAAPDGTTTADKLAETATTSTHAFGQTVTLAASSTITASVYFKSAERTFAYLQINDSSSSNAGYTSFDLSNGTVAQAPTLLIGTLTNMSSTISSVGNGWYRAQFTVTLNTIGNPSVYVGAATDATTRTYAGVNGSGIYVWGAQLQTGAIATPYIPTTTAAVTAYSLTSLSTWTVLTDTDVPIADASTNKALVSLGVGSDTNNRLSVIRFPDTSIAPLLYSGGSGAGASGYVVTPLSRVKTATAFNSGTLYFTLNGGSVTSGAATATVGLINKISIGNRNDDLVAHNGPIHRIALYTRALSNQQLVRLTT